MRGLSETHAVVPLSGPAVYFARAVDGLDRSNVLSQGQEVARALAACGMRMIDPVAEWEREVLTGGALTEDAGALVHSDLRLLRKADGLLMDMSIPDRNYVGCVCELTYGYQWRIPTVVWVGDTGLERRPYLRYHAATVVRDQPEAIAAMIALLG